MIVLRHVNGATEIQRTHEQHDGTWPEQTARYVNPRSSSLRRG